MKTSIFSGALIGLTMATSVSASVSLKNGNFFVGYTDASYQGGMSLDWQRVYNSKSSYKGIYGWGWGTELEAKLVVSADGSAVIHEFGGGAENRFLPSDFSVKELDEAVEKIAGVAKTSGFTGSAAQLASYKEKLRKDATFRNEEWEKFRSQGKLEARKLPEGAILHSMQFSYQKLTKTKDGYIRVFDSGKVQTFDEDGKLILVKDKVGNRMDLSYLKDGHLKNLVITSAGNSVKKMEFEFNNKGLLSKLTAENGIATYEYNKQDELIKSKDVDGNTYTYKYDKDRHNMVEIGYSDKTSMVIAYHGRDKKENVKSVKDRDGTFTDYDYVYDKANSNHITVSLKITGPDKKLISSSKYDYYLKIRPDGSEINERIVSVVDGETTDTLYNDHGLPKVISRGKDKTTIDYDPFGRVTRKETPSDLTELEYDQKCSKVSIVKKFLMPEKKRIEESVFTYNEKCNLATAKNKEGKGVKLVYDVNGRIQSMLDQDKHQISFKYNEDSKPVEIIDPSIGTISVTYANNGEIKKVESPAGRKIALQVTTAFQNLLDIIRPAGVTLSF